MTSISAPERGAAASANLPEPPSGGGAFAALKHRNFRLLWVGLLVSNSGTWLQNVAQDYLVYRLTGRALDLGIVNVARAVALIVLPFVGGTIADRVDRRKMLLFTQVAFAVLAALLGVLVQVHAVKVWHVVLLSFLSAVLLAFDQPVRLSLVPSLVPREDLANAIALNSITYSGAAAIGPALAGPLVALFGIDGAIYVNALSFGAVIYAAAAMRLPTAPPAHATGKRENVLEAVTSGVRYVVASPPLLLLVGMLLFFSLLAAPYQTVLPVFNGKFYGGDVKTLGWMRAAPGIGTLIGGFLIARWAETSNKRRLLAVGGIGYAGAILCFALASHLPLALFLLLLSGALFTTFVSTEQTLLQRLASDRMRGRVMSLYTICLLGMWPLGALPLAWCSDRFGVRASVVFSTVLALAYMAVALWRGRRVLADAPL